MDVQLQLQGLRIIIIIMWLVLRWTLPFLRACSMLADRPRDERCGMDNTVEDMLIEIT